MRNFAQASFEGRLTADPDTKYTQGGTPVANLRIAIGRDFKNKATGEWSELTLFVNVKAWGDHLVKRCQGLVKGQMVRIDAELDPDHWTDKAGFEHKDVVFTARHIVAASIPKADEPRPTADPFDDDLPY